MRLCFATTQRHARWGGSEALWVAGATSALAAGHQVDAHLFRWRPRAVPVEALERAGATLHERPPLLRLRYGVATRVPSRALAGVSAGPNAPDLVCISQGGTFNILKDRGIQQLVEGCRAKGVPYVLLCHGNVDGVSLGDLGRSRARQLFGDAAAVAFVAEATREQVERQTATRLDNAVLVRNPVNLASLDPVDWTGTGDRIRFAMVGALDGHTKGVDISLACLAGPAWRARDWALDIYGEGADASWFAELVDHYDLASRVRLAGPTHDIREVWSDHDVLLLPSRIESAPLVLAEAMLCGRPAVVTDVGDVAAWVRDGDTGFVASAATPRAFGAALESAWAARESLPRMGAKARALGEELVSPDAGGELLALLESCVSRAD